MLKILLAGVMALGAILPAGAQQESYPARPVRIIVPFPGGGATDYIARYVGDKLSQRLGKAFIIENRNGAGGMLGIDAALKSPADGYTLLVSSASYTVLPSLMKLPYDPVRDIAPVINMVIAPLVVTVNAKVPIKSLKELVGYARTNPDKLAYASNGIGSTVHVLTEAFMANTQTKMVHVPYKGIGPAIADLVSGQVQVLFTDPGAVYQFVAAGRVRALAIGGSRRFEQLLPGVPTADEAGYPGLPLASWQGMFAPKGTPPATVAKLNAEVTAIFRDKDVVEHFAARFATPVGGTPAEFAAQIKSDIETWGSIVRNAGIHAEQ
jgi:tripartite-type tricarboxylate transporter receptor subunit TctC